MSPNPDKPERDWTVALDPATGALTFRGDEYEVVQVLLVARPRAVPGLLTITKSGSGLDIELQRPMPDGSQP